MVKYSKQREIIKEVMNGRKDHPVASAIYDDVRKKDKNISLATVYRNLNMLVENGELIKLFIDNEEHFDPCLEEHFHFVCDKCGAIVDIKANEDIKKLKNKLVNNSNCEVTNFDIIMHGLCKSCKKLIGGK